MGFLYDEVWFWLIVSFVLGWVAHMLYSQTNKTPRSEADQQDLEDTPPGAPEDSNKADGITNEKTEATVELDTSWQPEIISRPDTPDDLKKIKGIGPVNEKALNALGIFHYSQIADWSEDNIKWVEGSLSFRGRIDREEWVKQAKELSQI